MAANFVELNRDLWDKRVRAHLQFNLYPSAKVEDGTYEVGYPDRDELGDVRGKRLLHLQCNAGADTLFWARQGASVVGLDFSQEAIAEARRLAAATALDATFVCSDVYAAHAQSLGLFDVVYTSTGVLWWLPDLDGWAKVIADHLAPGGFFYIHEIHPASMIYDWESDGLDVAHDYFTTEPMVEEGSAGTYYESGPDFECEPATEVGWTHTLGGVITALASAGLRVEYLHEHDFAQFRQYKCFEKNDAGEWRPKDKPRLPWTFSLKATK
jgi:SAM-dependent methyltransferase